MDEYGVRVKFQRRESEASNEIKVGRLVCHICSEKGKMQSCVICAKGSCANHSMIIGIQNLSRICDVCFREKTISEMTSKNDVLENISHEISKYAEKRDTTTQILNKESAKIRNSQKEIQDKEIYYKNRIKELEERIENTKIKVSCESKELPELQRDLLKYQMHTEMTKKKYQELAEEIVTSKAEVEILIKERTGLVSDLNEVTEFIRSNVPVKLIRQIICNSCYQRVRHEFVQMFRPVVQIKDEVKTSQVINSQQRKGVCTSCLVF